MHRRQFLAAAAATMAAPAAQAQAAGFVTSDFAPLKRVVVCEPSVHDYIVTITDETLFPGSERVSQAMVDQHRALQALLRQSGAEVLELRDLVQSAIDNARSKGVWQTWLRTTHPRIAARHATVTADLLLGRDPAVQFEADEAGAYRHYVDGAAAKMFTRDIGVMTPKGMLLSNFLFPHRRIEAVVARFLFDFAPQLSRYPIVVDFTEEDLIAEGGDFQVVDADTLFMATGNRTDPRAAPLLARRLNMDVVAVQTRKADILSRRSDWGPIRRVLLHLDTYFTHLGPKRALALPWLLESEFAETNPLTRYFRGMARSGGISEDDAEAAAGFLKDFGVVSRFKAGSGEADPKVKDMKLVDYVRREGYRVDFVGGTPPKDPDLQYLFDVVMDEHSRQAANVVATAPLQVVAYGGSPRTHEGLRQAGVQVSAFEARELWPGNGGPHCLTLPLERA